MARAGAEGQKSADIQGVEFVSHLSKIDLSYR